MRDDYAITTHSDLYYKSLIGDLDRQKSTERR